MSYFTPYKEHYKALIRLGIPIVIGQIGIVVVGLADNMMVGQYATLDLAAASFVNSAFNIPILFGLGFSYLERQALGDERAEALAAVAVADDMERVVGQRVAEPGGDLAANDRAERAVCVADVQRDGAGLRLGGVEALFKLLHQDAHVGGLFQLEVVNILRVEVYVGVLDQRILQKRGQVHLTGAGACGRGFDLEQVGAAHQLIDGAHAELCHVLAQVLGHEAHKVHDVLGLALEPLAQLGVLGADAHGAGVQVADTHHHAAFAHQQGGAEAELLSAQHTADGNIAAGEQLGIALNADAAAQANSG